MAENVELYAEAILGKDAEEFLSSDIGRYLVGRADQEAGDAMDALKRCEATDSAQIQRLQNQIWRAESVREWIGEIVIQGRQALSQLENQED